MVTGLQEITYLLGLPQKFSTDQGLELKLNNRILTSALKEMGCKHHVSSSYKASSNGLAESAVRSAKLLMKKAEIGRHDLKIMLYYCNNTPCSCGLSPAELLLQRRVRTALP